MTNEEFIDYAIALLLAKFGRNAVVKSLATKLELSLSELDLVIKGADKAKSPRKLKTRAPQRDRLKSLIAKNPEKGKELQILSDRFQNRTFLPQLRDVRRFFAEHGEAIEKIKSRSACLPKLMKLLADTEKPILEELCRLPESTEYSSLGVISDEILRGEN